MGECGHRYVARCDDRILWKFSLICFYFPREIRSLSPENEGSWTDSPVAYLMHFIPVAVWRTGWVGQRRPEENTAVILSKRRLARG